MTCCWTRPPCSRHSASPRSASRPWLRRPPHGTRSWTRGLEERAHAVGAFWAPPRGPDLLFSRLVCRAGAPRSDLCRTGTPRDSSGDSSASMQTVDEQTRKARREYAKLLPKTQIRYTRAEEHLGRQASDRITVFTRISAAALITFSVIRVRRLCRI